ncbi:MAG: hypothetical protein CL763_08660 [Chloroflexi bacterium]|nr:hypothetical protein [Chloroflexota bacterium]|tara:strand:+ start:12545 stop:13621 length:1077 start_codon:yes stop_codon:yes gene_type:complete
MLDRENLQNDFQKIVVDKTGKQKQRKRGKTDGELNCLEMGMVFLKNERDISKFTPKMLNEFIETIVDIWKPEGNNEAIQRKKKAKKELKEILEKFKKNPDKYIVNVPQRTEKITYENSKWIFEEWEKNIQEKINNYSLDLANPFMMASVEKSFAEGKIFAIKQIQTRIAVTYWGGIFEKCFSIFTTNVESFNAGRMDIKVKKILFDIKSGPNVLNQRDVDGINKKIELISGLKKKSFGKFIEVEEYKVGIIYGRWKLRNSFMKKIIGAGNNEQYSKKSGIVIGTDLWKLVTDNEWNAFKFFIWQIRYGVQELKKKWTLKDLNDAVDIFLDSFYGNRDNKSKAEEDTEYKKVKKLIEKN